MYISSTIASSFWYSYSSGRLSRVTFPYKRDRSQPLPGLEQGHTYIEYTIKCPFPTRPAPIFYDVVSLACNAISQIITTSYIWHLTLHIVHTISKDLESAPWNGHVQCNPRRKLTRDLSSDISFNGGTRVLSPSDADADLAAETCETMPATLLRKCNCGHATKTCNKDLWIMCDWIGV